MPSITKWKPPSFYSTACRFVGIRLSLTMRKKGVQKPLRQEKLTIFFNSILLFRVKLKFYLFIYCFFLDTFILCTVLNNNSRLLDAQSGGCISICEWRKENSLRFLSLMFYVQPHSWTQALPNTSDTTSSASCHLDTCSRQKYWERFKENLYRPTSLFLNLRSSLERNAAGLNLGKPTGGNIPNKTLILPTVWRGIPRNPKITFYRIISRTNPELTTKCNTNK